MRDWDKYGNGEIDSFLVEEEYSKSNKFMLNHNWRLVGGFALMFIIGGVQALKGLSWADGAQTVIPVLLVVEHFLFGKTD